MPCAAGGLTRSRLRSQTRPTDAATTGAETRAASTARAADTAHTVARCRAAARSRADAVTTPRADPVGFNAARITPATYRPDADPQISKTVGWNPDPPAVREASSQAAGTVTYSGDSPTGYQPSTGGQDWDQQVMRSF